MAPTPLAFPELVKRMEGRDTLNQWDVLVSYDEDTVNALLKARAQQTGLFQQITLPPVVTKGKSLFLPFSIVYHLCLARSSS